LAKFDSNGNPLNVIGIGSNAIEGGMGVGTDANDNVYVVGYFLGETLTIGSVTLNNQDIGGTSDFLLRNSTATESRSGQRAPALQWVTVPTESQLMQKGILM